MEKVLKKYDEYDDFVNDITGGVGDHQLQAGMRLENQDNESKKIINHCHNHDLHNLSNAIISNIADVDPETWKAHQQSADSGRRKVTHEEYTRFTEYAGKWKHIYLKTDESQTSKGKSLQAYLVGQTVSEKFPESLDHYTKVTRRKEIYEWAKINGKYAILMNETKLNRFKTSAEILDLPPYNDGRTYQCFLAI